MTPGLCECGCGGQTAIATWTRKARGWIKGQHKRFLHGHATKKRRGEAASNWKGGAHVGSSGYVLMRQSDDPRTNSSGYRKQHIVIAEKAIGRKLAHPHVVHHVNGVKTDNRPENLVICEDHQYHMLLHRRTEAYYAGKPMPS